MVQKLRVLGNSRSDSDELLTYLVSYFKNCTKLESRCCLMEILRFKKSVGVSYEKVVKLVMMVRKADRRK